MGAGRQPAPAAGRGSRLPVGTRRVFFFAWWVGIFYSYYSFLPAPLPCGVASSLQKPRLPLRGASSRSRGAGSGGVTCQNNNNNKGGRGPLSLRVPFPVSPPRLPLRHHKPTGLPWEQVCHGRAEGGQPAGRVVSPPPAPRGDLGRKNGDTQTPPPRPVPILLRSATLRPGSAAARRGGKGRGICAGFARARRAPPAAVLTRAAPGLRLLLRAGCPDPSIYSWKNAAHSYSSYEQLILH